MRCFSVHFIFRQNLFFFQCHLYNYSSCFCSLCLYFLIQNFHTTSIYVFTTYLICQHSLVFILLKYKFMLLPRLWIHKWRKSDLLLFHGRNKAVYFYIVYQNFYSFKRKQKYNFIFVYAYTYIRLTIVWSKVGGGFSKIVEVHQHFCKIKL